MAEFVSTNKAPGVYIQEIQLLGPIAGVSTSTAAFVGPARNGPLFTPVRLANWSDFITTFGLPGPQGPDPYFPNPPVYVTHAVRGFFDNGGSLCYFVRVGTAKRAALPLDDRANPPNSTLVVTAKREGTAGNGITVQVQDASIKATTAARGQATLANAKLTQATVTVAADAATLRPGDIVLLDDGGGNSETASIASISGTTITFDNVLARNYNAGTIRVADLAAGQTKFRAADSTGIEPGTYLTITDGANTESGIVQAVTPQNNVITLAQGLANSYKMGAADPAVDLKSQEFTLIVAVPNAAAQPFANLSMDPRHSRYFRKVVNSPTVDVTKADPPNPTLPPSNIPAVLAATPLAGGANDNVSQIQALHYHNGIDALKKQDGVNILCVPDRTDQDVQQYMIDHCKAMQDRFAILDPQPNASPVAITTQLIGDPAVGNLGLSSPEGYAALYYPQIVIDNPIGTDPLMVPPSGHIAGVYARTDNDKGVHKAPANEQLMRALDLERVLADDEQGPLNEQGINVIRAFPGRGVLVWGARTISPSTQWRYVSTRRLLIFLEKSIQQGTQFVVFEPNEPALWEQVKRTVTDFLTRVWRDGALFGVTADQAFRVRVDEELNPPDVRALGQLVIEVVVIPAMPAEFVIFRIIQDPTGAALQESA